MLMKVPFPGFENVGTIGSGPFFGTIGSGSTLASGTVDLILNDAWVFPSGAVDFFVPKIIFVAM